MTHLKEATHRFKGLRDTTDRVLSIARCHFFQLLVLSVLLLPLPALGAVCPPEGSGGDPILNQLKNRDAVPPAYKEMTVDQFPKALIPDLETPRHRNKFSAAAQGYVENNEAQGIVLIGYILGARLSGPESANCNDLRRRDFHIWIGAKKPRSFQGSASRLEIAHFAALGPKWCKSQNLRLGDVRPGAPTRGEEDPWNIVGGPSHHENRGVE